MPLLRRSLALATLALALAATSALADLPRTYQVQRIENPSPAFGDRFGDGFVNAGDVNGDGEDDILVGIDEHGMIEGKVHVFSGEDGSIIRTIPPPDPDAVNAGGPGGDNPAAFGTYVGKIADIGGCPGFSGPLGDDCTASQGAMDTPDGTPDHLVSAIGVDIVDANGDDMGIAYVFDGATGAVLKRIRMPVGDRNEQAQNRPDASQGPAFGRTILSPSGQPPCDGFGGLANKQEGGAPIPTPCPYTAGSAVARGDMDAGGEPDIVIGASDFGEGDDGSASNPNPNCGTEDCHQAGRFYVYRGEDLQGLGPGTALGDSYYTIKNPVVQDDDPRVNSRFQREAMGYSVAPVGDLGQCDDTDGNPNTEPGPLGDSEDPDDYYCMNFGTPNRANVATDGRPDFIASSHRYDFNGMGDTGIAFAIDGPTGRILDVYNHPEPKISSIFAFSNYNQPALGDAGSSNKPDIYQGAMVHDVQHRAQGRGWVLSGDFTSGGANHYGIAVLDDPTPNQIGNFSTSSGGVGDLDGDSRKELMIGAYGPHAPQVIQNVISDVHIFAPLGEQVLQTIPDPDQQPGSGFGRGLAPLGDLNDDGFLDFAVGAGGYDPGAPTACSPCTPVASNPAQGRMYILRSDNSPAPPGAEPGSTQGTAGPQGPQGPQGPAATLAGRTLELAAVPVRRRSRRGARVSIRRGRALRLVGKLESFANESACVSRQTVQLQRRGPRSATYRRFSQATTDSDGDFSARFTPRRTYVYRARVLQTDACLGAVSNRERVKVTRRR